MRIHAYAILKTQLTKYKLYKINYMSKNNIQADTLSCTLQLALLTVVVFYYIADLWLWLNGESWPLKGNK